MFFFETNDKRARACQIQRFTERKKKAQNGMFAFLKGFEKNEKNVKKSVDKAEIG